MIFFLGNGERNDGKQALFDTWAWDTLQKPYQCGLSYKEIGCVYIYMQHCWYTYMFNNIRLGIQHCKGEWLPMFYSHLNRHYMGAEKMYSKCLNSYVEAFPDLMHMDLHWSNLYLQISIYYPWVFHVCAHYSLYLILYFYNYYKELLALIFFSFVSEDVLAGKEH